MSLTRALWYRGSRRASRRDQASRAISTARLKRSRALHLPPINLVVSQGPSGALRLGSVHLGEGFPLRCIQRLSPRDIANRRCAWRHSRDTSGRFVRVLSYYGRRPSRSEEHTSELQSLAYLVCRLLLEKKKRPSNCCVIS